MTTLRIFSVAIVPLVACLGSAGSAALLGACSSGSTTSGTPDGGAQPQQDASSGQDGSPDAGEDGGPLTVVPSVANVLTCDTLPFKGTGGAGGGTWTATTGKVDPQSGLYSAPLTAAAGTSSTITYTESSGSASASVTLATAFLGTLAPLPTNNNSNSVGTHSPFEHTFTASGSRVYSAIQRAPGADGTLLEADLYVSNDSGKTFTAGAVYHTGNLEANCITVAIDAGNPDVVYLTYYAGHGDSTSNTGSTVRLAVSTDGAKTFPVEYVVADSVDSMVNMICPDVISPSPDHVIVSGIAANSVPSEWAATFVSGNRGANIGPVGTEGVAKTPNPGNPTSTYSASDTNSSTAQANCGLASNGGNGGPRLFTNGTGNVCVAYTGSGGCSPANGFFVQCSADSGSTWSAPFAVATPSGVSDNVLYGSVSKSGNVALVWADTVANKTEIMLAISKDAGKTFGTPFQYPSAARNGVVAGSYTYDPTIEWQSDNVLWLSQTLNGSDSPVLMVDKSCDYGASWSGAINAGPYKNASLLSTSSGMVVAGFASGTTTIGTIPLAQNAH